MRNAPSSPKNSGSIRTHEGIIGQIGNLPKSYTNVKPLFESGKWRIRLPVAAKIAFAMAATTAAASARPARSADGRSSGNVLRFRGGLRHANGRIRLKLVSTAWPFAIVISHSIWLMRLDHAAVHHILRRRRVDHLAAQIRYTVQILLTLTLLPLHPHFGDRRGRTRDCRVPPTPRPVPAGSFWRGFQPDFSATIFRTADGALGVHLGIGRDSTISRAGLQKLQPELHRILARGMGQFVDEGLINERESVVARRAQRSERHARGDDGSRHIVVAQ